MWRKKWEKANDREHKYEKYQETAFPLVMGQCFPALQAQLEGSKGFDKINDRIWLELMNPIHVLNLYQKSGMTNNEYLDELKVHV